MVRKTITLLFLLFFAFSGKADYWELPTCKRYYSVDSNATVYVVPACLTVTNKRKNSIFDTCSGECLKKKPCIATVYKEGLISKGNLYSFTMINLYAPHQVFISNDGVYVISMDDWGMVGKGKNVLVIYKNGILSKKYTLSEISPIPLWNYFESVSSFHWFDKFCFVDNNAFEIYFRDRNKIVFKKLFNLNEILK